jgi:ribosome-associated toxin RatA of RatAB toxin-antitoxin module
VVELKLTTTTTKTVKSLCDAAFGTGKFDPAEPDLKARTILSQSENERVTYEQISPPLVANRDYAVRAKRLFDADGSCRMTFEAANEVAPKSPDGWVRISKLKGVWRFEPQADGRTKVTYLIHSDPAGSIPTFMVEGSRKSIAVKWVKMLLSRGTLP